MTTELEQAHEAIAYLRKEQERLYEILDIPITQKPGTFRFDTLVSRLKELKESRAEPEGPSRESLIEAVKELFAWLNKPEQRYFVTKYKQHADIIRYCEGKDD